MSETLDLAAYHERAEDLAAQRKPVAARPSADDERSYVLGVRHGYTTALVWAVMMLETVDQVATLTRADAVVEITELMLTSGIEKHKVSAEEHIVFESEAVAEDRSS